jgi:hypothetical protein
VTPRDDAGEPSTGGTRRYATIAAFEAAPKTRLAAPTAPRDENGAGAVRWHRETSFDTSFSAVRFPPVPAGGLVRRQAGMI